MPLRSKITNPALGARSFSMDANYLDEQPGDEADDVIFGKTYGVRTLELNRPKKLNSLNGSMARKLIRRLQEYEKSDMANVIILKGAGRAFCAGGDVAALAKWDQEGKEGQRRSSEYFALEYRLDHLIASYTRPLVAFMDGITMGGGVGLSVHAPFRIATEKTVYAMPETTIGFFPDVGASFFLPRMDGNLGTYLALTSEQLKGADAFYHGVATHFIHSTTLPRLEDRLGELTFKDHQPLDERFRIIDATIEEFATGLEPGRPSISGELRKAIDYIFDPHTSIEEILSKLQRAASRDDQLKEWAEKTLDTINQRSPTSVMVALKQMTIGKEWNIAETFRHEHNIASKFMAHPDFVEGVTARLIDRKKERPDWKPNTFDKVSREEINAFFQQQPTLELLNSGERSQYKEYPHAWIALPKEDDVLKVMRKEQLMPEEVIKHFVTQTRGKQGVRQKVSEILERYK